MSWEFFFFQRYMGQNCTVCTNLFSKYQGRSDTVERCYTGHAIQNQNNPQHPNLLLQMSDQRSHFSPQCCTLPWDRKSLDWHIQHNLLCPENPHGARSWILFIILGISEAFRKLTTPQQHFVSYGLIAAKKQKNNLHLSSGKKKQKPLHWSCGSQSRLIHSTWSQ